MAYRFAEFRVDPDTRTVERAGRPVPLTAKAFDLLMALVERPDVVVTKDDLMSAVWPDTAVEENNLTVTMSTLRKALGDPPAHPRLILTVPAHGYRFVAEVVRDDRPPEARPARRGNLPETVTRFIGREQERADVIAMVRTRRLVTLTGSGGCGKTRLAIEAARGLDELAPDGVWLVELAPLSDPGLIAQAIATTLGLRGETGTDRIAALVDWLREQTAILVLDNCEHVIEASASVTETLLSRLPSLRVLATSRESLGVPGEQVWRVPSMTGSDAVRLFAERAQSIAHEFRLTGETEPVVEQICRRLDGMPLAVELAAARIGVLPVAQIARRLDDQFQLLTGGARTALPRHRTLRASIDWSHGLLTPAEQDLFRRLSVCYGGWTIEAAEAIAADESGQAVVLDVLTSLVKKSLVVAESGGSVPRYRMLEAIRQYAREQLTESGDEDRVRRRHLLFFRALAEQVEQDMLGSATPPSLLQAAVEVDNFRTALDWALGRDAESSLRLAGALQVFWVFFGHFREAGERLEQAIARASPDVSDSARAKALLGAATIAFFRADLDTMSARSRQVLPLARSIGAEPLVAYALLYLACHDIYVNRDFDSATTKLDEALVLARRLNNPFLIAIALLHRRVPAMERGAVDDADTWTSEALALARQSGNGWLLAVALANASLVALARGDRERALSLGLASVRMRAKAGDRWGLIESFIVLARVAADDGQEGRASHLLGVAAGLGRAIGAGVPFMMQAVHATTEAVARAALGDEGFAAARAAGMARPLDDVIAELAAAASPDVPADQP